MSLRHHDPVSANGDAEVDNLEDFAKLHETKNQSWNSQDDGMFRE
jgi:hypothetical protein